MQGPVPGIRAEGGKINRTVLVYIVLICFLGAMPTNAQCDPKRILVVHSYDPNHVSMPKRNGGLKKVFKSAPGIEVEYFYMDTKRQSALEWKNKIGKAVRDRIASYNPDVVIAFDDNALKYALKPYIGSEALQVVVAGINGEPEDYGLPASNVTGILERTYPNQTLSMLAMIDPAIKKVVYISDDSTTADGVITYIQSYKMPIEIVGFEQPATFKAWKQIIRKYENDASVHAFLIPLYQTVKADQGETRIKPAEVMNWTVNNVSKPVAGLWPFATKDGALCAVTVDLTEHGIVAAQMALQILEGEKAGQIPIVKNKDGFVILNTKSAERLDMLIPFEIIQAADRILE